MECGRRKSDLQQINYRHVAAVEFRSVAISFFVPFLLFFHVAERAVVNKTCVQVSLSSGWRDAGPPSSCADTFALFPSTGNCPNLVSYCPIRAEQAPEQYADFFVITIY